MPLRLPRLIRFAAIAAPVALAGCVSIPPYAPPATGQTAALEVIKSPTSFWVHGTGYAVFADPDCQEGGALDWMTWATQKSRTTTIAAGTPVYLHALTFGDRGDGRDWHQHQLEVVRLTADPPAPSGSRWWRRSGRSSVRRRPAERPHGRGGTNR